MTDKFSGDETYEEWISKQYNGLELKIIQEIHNAYPNWTLEDIKRYAPDFVSAHVKIVKEVHENDSTLNMKDIEKRIFNYMKAGIYGNKVHIEVFGEMKPCDDYYYLAKWNNGLCKIMDILLSSSKYKTEDDNGHAAGQSFKLADKQYSFRAEKQLDRDIHKIIDRLDDKYETKSDFFREIIFKGTEIFAFMDRHGLGPVAENVWKTVHKYRSYYEEEELQLQKDLIEEIIDQKYERLDRLLKNRSSKEALTEFRNELVEYLRDNLSLPRKRQDKEEIIACIKDSRKLEKILDRLEEEQLVSREFVESILKEGKLIHFTAPMDIISD